MQNITKYIQIFKKTLKNIKTLRGPSKTMKSIVWGLFGSQNIEYQISSESIF